LQIPKKMVVDANISAVVSSFLISKAKILFFTVMGLLAIATGLEGKFLLNIASSWS
jgi:hypothetical protein